MTILEKISVLSPSEFENLTYDCLRACGLKNMVWRTPGADGGRDIEGIAYGRDLSGHETIQTWYIECKRYSVSIDWPTVWEKIAYADAQGADILLISTNSNPSPQCEERVRCWNEQRRRPSIRFWRGYESPRILNANLQVAASYGLVDSKSGSEAGALRLALLITKISQSAYVASELGVSYGAALEAASTLSELLSQRIDDLIKFNRLVPSAKATSKPSFHWAEILGDAENWEDVSLRSLLAFLRYQMNATSLRVEIDGERARVLGVGSKLNLSDAALEDLKVAGHWARAEFTLEAAPNTIMLYQRT